MSSKANDIDTTSYQTIPAYSAKEEYANTVIHLFGAILSIIGLCFLIINSADNIDITKAGSASNALRIACFSIYGASLILLFVSSSLYHSTKNVELKKLFKLFDHCAIYILIAGTYTPILLISLKGPIGYWSASLIWLIAIAGLTFKIKTRQSKSPQKYKVISLSTYLGMGLISVTLLGELYDVLPIEALFYLAGGGFIYCVGVFFYVQKKVPFTHAIWHVFVLAAAVCHFFMIYLYV
jgi:hemolysin III|tara:strand:- start:490 stop:1203 length:714 start_codon:yes stop_codon:yes gene_type:complete